ncbi:MAG: hypothetical protein WAW96_19775 [Alphaproteobacteria bacterium]
MAGDQRSRKRRIRRRPAANDNGEAQLSLAVIGNWPLEIAVREDELVLFETYLSDLVALIAANDNDPSEKR